METERNATPASLLFLITAVATAKTTVISGQAMEQ